MPIITPNGRKKVEVRCYNCSIIKDDYVTVYQSVEKWNEAQNERL
jgi:hypothetical protein